MARLQTLTRHAISELRAHGTDSAWWERRAREWKNTPAYAPRFTRDRSINVMADSCEWDTLVVLDACRYDLFEETIDTAPDTGRFDDYRRVMSPASATSGWTRYSFPDEYGDTVYVTGNPTTTRYAPMSFHRLVETWRDAFDSDIGSVPADRVTDAALDVHDDYPNKRLIVHYIQPHYPFVRDPDLNFAAWANTPEFDNPHADSCVNDVWEALEKGYVDRDSVWHGYRRNLEYVMEDIDRLLDGIDGRTVVTSDHGNLLGERLTPVIGRQAYGHPTCRRHPILNTVPWAVVDGDRRAIVDGGVRSDSVASESEVSDRLQALGYVE